MQQAAAEDERRARPPCPRAAGRRTAPCRPFGTGFRRGAAHPDPVGAQPGAEDVELPSVPQLEHPRLQTFAQAGERHPQPGRWFLDVEPSPCGPAEQHRRVRSSPRTRRPPSGPSMATRLPPNGSVASSVRSRPSRPSAMRCNVRTGPRGKHRADLLARQPVAVAERDQRNAAQHPQWRRLAPETLTVPFQDGDRQHVGVRVLARCGDDQLVGAVRVHVHRSDLVGAPHGVGHEPQPDARRPRARPPRCSGSRRARCAACRSPSPARARGRVRARQQAWPARPPAPAAGCSRPAVAAR